MHPHHFNFCTESSVSWQELISKITPCGRCSFRKIYYIKITLHYKNWVKTVWMHLYTKEAKRYVPIFFILSIKNKISYCWYSDPNFYDLISDSVLCISALFKEIMWYACLCIGVRNGDYFYKSLTYKVLGHTNISNLFWLNFNDCNKDSSWSTDADFSKFLMQEWFYYLVVDDIQSLHFKPSSVTHNNLQIQGQIKTYFHCWSQINMERVVNKNRHERSKQGLL